MTTRNNLTVTEKIAMGKPHGPSLATVKSMAPTMPAPAPTKKMAPAMPKTAANNNAATGLRHWIVGCAVAEFVVQNGPLNYIHSDESSWVKMWDDLGSFCDAALANAGMSPLAGAHQLKCYIPGFVAQSAVRVLFGRSAKTWSILPTNWRDLVKSGLVDSGTFTDILSRMPLGKLTDDAHTRLVALNGDKNAVRALLASL